MSRLFAAEVATHCVWLPSRTDVLLPEEQHAARSFAPVRMQEFAAGRHCARQALLRLGAPASAIPIAADRRPVWPEGIVGSITHTQEGGRGFAAAALGRSGAVRSIGLDAELDAELEPQLWNIVLLGTERAWLATQPSSRRGQLAKLVFCAKEAAYKCQYPLTGEFLDFPDLEIRTDLASNRFSARFQRGAGQAFTAGAMLEGHFSIESGLIIAAVELR